MQTLEAEVARLQQLDAHINTEKNTLAHQNNAMRELLASHSLDLQLGSIDLSSSSQPIDELSQLGGAMVDIRFDPEIGHDRTFLDLLDLSDMAWTSVCIHFFACKTFILTDDTFRSLLCQRHLKN